MDSRNNVVIFQPEKPPIEFLYDESSNALIEKQAINLDFTRKAKANALWGSLAYKKDYYSVTN